MNIILLGPPGSGKGTQAKILAQHFGYTHISTGQLFRQLVEKKDPTALKIKTFADQGKLAPDSLVLKLVKEHLATSNLFDGFPRTLLQAEKLDQLATIHLVIELSLPDQEVIKRLSTRRECSKCRATYGSKKPPQKNGICDLCGAKLIHREDDKPPAIKTRLEHYHDETEPLLEYYKPRNITHTIDALNPIEKVFKELCTLIERHQNSDV